MPDQRSLLRGRLAAAIDGVVDIAARLGPPVTNAKAPPPPPPPLESIGRPWTLAAAMEPVLAPVVERVPPPRAMLPQAPPEPPPPLEHHRSRTPLVILGSSVASVVMIAVLAIRLLQGGAAVRAPANPPAEIALTGVRPVASAPAAGGALPVTQVSFPAKTPVVDIEVNSGGAAGQAPVQVVVTVGQPAQTIIQNDYVLSPSGDTVIPLAPPGGTFAPGNYAVTITDRGELLGSTVFSVH
ncbi:MAG TPA: hypothetical protein VND54_09565 [Candidatus Saccharimonadales bacterium]|nr:hypothetical protein [Candidatus Saccharimonadales bacterium]